MRVKDVNLNWKVLNYDLNTKKLYAMNCLGHDLVEEIAKKIRYKGSNPNKYNSIRNLEELKECVKDYLRYHYYGRVEVELLIGDPFIKDIESLEKIDAWKQLEINFDRIVEYIIQKMQIKFKRNGEIDKNER